MKKSITYCFHIVVGCVGGWNLALSVCVLMAFARCSPVCALRSRLRLVLSQVCCKGTDRGGGRDYTSGSNLMVGMALCSLHFCFALPFAFVANHALTRTMLAQGGRAGSKTNHDCSHSGTGGNGTLHFLRMFSCCSHSVVSSRSCALPRRYKTPTDIAFL